LLSAILTFPRTANAWKTYLLTVWLSRYGMEEKIAYTIRNGGSGREKKSGETSRERVFKEPHAHHDPA